MSNKWYTFGFLGLMVISLVTLAVLQYKWLGSVSDAEKERLEESLSASSGNFVAEYNRVFSDLADIFHIQVSNPGLEIERFINESYLTWISNGVYPDLIDSIYVLQPSENEEPNVFLFSSDPAMLTLIEKPNTVDEWISNHYDQKNGNHSSSYRSRPYFGEPSFLPVPIQLLDMVQISNQKSGRNIEVQLSIDQLDDLVLIKLDDEFIKKEIIPSIARTYFSDSFEDQYQISLIRNDENKGTYYTSSEDGIVSYPDIKKPLDAFSFSNVMVFQSRFDEDERLPGLSKNETTGATFLSLKSQSRDTIDSFFSSETNLRPRIYTDNLTSITIKDSDSTSTDTSFSSSFSSLLGSSGLELWLSFKEGSLDTFVDNARKRNLAISFGILGILGVSMILIVLFSQRSRELAEQQMLFVAGVSHELRTPITVIRSAAENLTEGVVQTEERKHQYAELMLKEGRRLSDMVDQIMEFSGIQSGKRMYHFKEIDLNKLLNSIKDESIHALNEYGMNMEYSISTKKETVYGDKEALFLSITNLINNGIKFSGDNKKILLKVDEAELRGKSGLRIQVQDFGIGIPEKEQKEVFKPFYRGEKSVRDQVKGNGIGLSLVKKVVEAHRGEIRLASKNGKGSTFSIVLPMEAEHG